MKRSQVPQDDRSCARSIDYNKIYGLLLLCAERDIDHIRRTMDFSPVGVHAKMTAQQFQGFELVMALHTPGGVP